MKNFNQRGRDFLAIAPVFHHRSTAPIQAAIVRDSVYFSSGLIHKNPHNLRAGIQLEDGFDDFFGLSPG